ncbi:LCP family protein [Deinococcus cellulosilyticus]|nr:LCP family protein [Deinococcus cellulosilyticus]
MEFEIPRKKRRPILWVILFLLVVFSGLIYVMVVNEIATQSTRLENQTLLLAGLEVAYCKEGSVSVPAQRCTSGTERMTSGGHTDTLLLITTLPGNAVQVVSVPRDIRVLHTNRRINTSYGMGGMPLLKQDLQDLTGIAIHHHAVIDTELAAQIVDRLGGLDVQVPVPGMKWIDHAAGVNFQLAAGSHHLAGQEAVLYLRVRKGAGDDYGRTQRQREALRQLMGRVKQPQHALALVGSLGELLKRTQTDLDVRSLLGYFPYASSKRIKSVQFSVREVAGTTLLEADRSRFAMELFPAMFKQPFSAEVVNSSELPGLARQLAAFLTARGVQVTGISTGANHEPHTLLELSEFNSLALDHYFLGSATEDLQITEHARIILGEDFPVQYPLLYKVLLNL